MSDQNRWEFAQGLQDILDAFRVEQAKDGKQPAETGGEKNPVEWMANKRLKMALKSADDEILERGKEIVRLKAENAELHKAHKSLAQHHDAKTVEVHKLKAEVERLRKVNTGFLKQSLEFEAENAAMRDALDSIQLPYPETVFPMTEDEYVAAIPDWMERSAISGFLMRQGWLVCMREVKDAIEEDGE